MKKTNKFCTDKEDFFLLTIENLLINPQEINDKKPYILEKIGTYIEADRVLYSQFNSNKHCFEVVDKNSEYLSSSEMETLIGTSPDIPFLKKLQQEHSPESNIHVVNDTLEFLKVNNIKENLWIEFYQKYDINASIVLYITKNNILLGVLTIHFKEKIDKLNQIELEFYKKLHQTIIPLFEENKSKLSLQIDEKLALKLGLTASILYGILKDHYDFNDYWYNYWKKTIDKDFYSIDIQKIKNLSFLSDDEIKYGLKKLAELSIITFKKINDKKLYFNFLKDPKEQVIPENKSQPYLKQIPLHYLDVQKIELFLIELEEIIKQKFSFHDLKQMLANKIGKFLEADRLMILEIDQNNGKFKIIDIEYRSDNSFRSMIGISWEIPSNKEMKDSIVQKMELFYDSDLSLVGNKMKDINPELNHFLEYYRVRSGMVCPLEKNGKLLGSINIQYGLPIEKSNPQIVDFFNRLANIVASIFPDNINQDNYIFIGNDVAKALGLTASAIYNTLLNRYEYNKNLFKLDSNGYCSISYADIKEVNVLEDIDISLAVEKLNEFSLINIKSHQKKSLSFKILNNDNFVDYNISDRKYESIEEYVKNSGLEKKGKSIENLSNALTKLCDDKYLMLVKHFFSEVEKKLDVKFLNLDLHIFYSTYHILVTFIDKEDLDFDTTKLIINCLFGNTNTNKNRVISFDKSTQLLSNRLKLVLIYHFVNLKYEFTEIPLSSFIDLFEL